VGEGLANDGNWFENVLNCLIRKRPFLKTVNFRRVFEAVAKDNLVVILRPLVSLLLFLQGTVRIRLDRFSCKSRMCDSY
jgi:hypothetical protein